jgi:ribose 5-phosphate isomerase A
MWQLMELTKSVRIPKCGTLLTHDLNDPFISDARLNCIKGGGGCLTQEKIVAAASRTFVVIADSRKRATLLGESWKKGIPIEVVPMAWAVVSKRIEQLGGRPTLRMAIAKAGPVVTDNSGFIIDADFGKLDDPAVLDQQLRAIVGVVETGLFVGMASHIFFGEADGSVSEKTL